MDKIKSVLWTAWDCLVIGYGIALTTIAACPVCALVTILVLIVLVVLT